MKRTLALALTSLFIIATALARKPNVIIFYTDDQGSLDANCYGSWDLITPTIEK